MTPQAEMKEIRFVELPPMRVAAARGFGASPELEAWAILVGWADEVGLDPYGGDHRFFGFNDPSPSAEGEEYGYQQWMTVPEDVAGSDDVEIKDYAGGQYVVTRCEGLAHITERWMMLYRWLQSSEHELGPEPGLEELLSPAAREPAEYVFDLHMPIVVR